MNILAIDTTTDKIVLALLKEGEEYDYIGTEGCKRHNSVLLEYVDTLLHNNNLSVNDIDCFGVVVGPGSFTGIRIGIATVNALSMATGAKIVEITSLEQTEDGSDKIVLLDCKHDNFYALAMEKNERRYFETNVAELDSFFLPKEYLTESSPKKIMKQCVKKALNEDFVLQAKPFYMKKSSAEKL